MSSIADRIREARRAKGLSQTDLARELQTTAMTVSRWERGVSEPQLSSCRAMSKAFGVSLDWLIDGSGTGPLKATGTEGS